MSALIKKNPEYRAVTIMRVDWDSSDRKKIAKELEVKNRATLVMFKEGQEVGRVSWKTSKKAIEPLFQSAL